MSYIGKNTSDIKCDVLVVGCGPGGSGAAYAAAKAKLKTIVVDRKKAIGSPIECGECIDPSLLTSFGITISDDIINARQDGTIFVINNQIEIDNHAQVWKSVAIDRQKLDKYLAYNAARAGASLIVGAEAVEASVDGNQIASVKIVTERKSFTVHPKIVIAADGTFSTIAKIQNRPKLQSFDIGMTVSYEMTNMQLKYPDRIQMFFDEICKFGYGYIIPKSKDSANVGIGMLGLEEHPWDHLEFMLENHPLVSPQIKDSGVIEIKKGATPILGQKLPLVNGNVLFVGDAAAQNLAHVGEGAIPSQICGRIAGGVAADYLQKGSDLNEYPERVSQSIGKIFDECEEVRDVVVDIWTSDRSLKLKNLLSGFLISEVIPPTQKDFLYSLEKLSLNDVVQHVSSFIKQTNRTDVMSVKII